LEVGTLLVTKVGSQPPSGGRFHQAASNMHNLAIQNTRLAITHARGRACPGAALEIAALDLVVNLETWKLQLETLTWIWV
jgi:hypothetical protein